MLVLDSSEGCITFLLVPIPVGPGRTQVDWSSLKARHHYHSCSCVPCAMPSALEGSHFKFWWWLRVDDAGIFGNWWWFEYELNDSWPPAWAEQLLTLSTFKTPRFNRFKSVKSNFSDPFCSFDCPQKITVILFTLPGKTQQTYKKT